LKVAAGYPKSAPFSYFIQQSIFSCKLSKINLYSVPGHYPALQTPGLLTLISSPYKSWKSPVISS
jgi:hypothetical protein